MAILGSIRKRPLFLIMIIGLAIFAFILSDGINSNNGGPNRNNIGSINGIDISNEEFSRRVDAQRNGSTSLQKINSVWDALVKEKVYEDQIEKTGIEIGEKEIWDALVNNPSYQNDPRFKNEEGLFDEAKLKEFIATIKSTKAGKTSWINQEKSIINGLKKTTYDNLIKAGLTASLTEGQRVYNSDNTSADVQFVYEPYSTIKSDEVKVTDAEVTTYVKNHADEFKAEASREIEYVKFDVKPSKEDIAIVEKEILKLKNDFTEYNTNFKKDETISGFTNTTDNTAFVNEYSDVSYLDKVYFTKDLPEGLYDKLVKLPVNSVYGPYVDGDYYKLVKFLGTKNEKSAKSSHILISYQGSASRNQNVTRTKEEAERIAKDLLKKVNKNNFADMAKENSDDSSASRGGSLGNWFKENGGLVKEYSDFIFNNRKDKIGFVETVFGYHIIKVDEIKNDAGLNLAIISRKIDPSELTESNIYQKAETFASDLMDGKDILELAKTGNFAVKKANNLTELSENVIGLGNQRSLVKWTFNKDTKVGDVKRFDLENAYVIAVLKNKFNKGLTSLAVAKPKVVPILENIKKAKIIKSKITSSSLDEIAKSLGKSINSANDITLVNPNLKVGGTDENIAGALLYMKEGDVKVIDGKSGIYAMKVVKKNPIRDIKKYDTYSNNLTTQLKGKSTQIYNALKEGCEIEDQRAAFY